MTTVTKGNKAPTFTLPDKDGQQVSLDTISTTYTIVYFYPKDNTSGCTLEAQNFEKDKESFTSHDVTVIGISGGDEKSKTKFVEKNNLTFTLLSDTDFSISKKYGVYGPKKFMGKEYMGISRTTFLLDKNKQVIDVFENVKPATHTQELIEYLETL